MVGLGKAKTKSASVIAGAGPGLSEDDYELQPSSYTDRLGLHSHSHGHSPASEPLLPQYDPKPASSPVPLAPHRQLERSRRRSRTCATLLCLWATLVPLCLGMALLGCWFGRKGLDSVRGWQAWEQVPQDIKDWVDTVAPYQVEVDHGAFPTDIGYAGPTPTGIEPAVLATAPVAPLHTGISPLVPPNVKTSSSFSIMQHWGNLSPYYSVSSHGLPETSSLFPDHCELEEVHWLQRHGARYPTSNAGGPGDLALRLKKASGWTATGEMSFLNDWEYRLGAELLTPFGRQQLFSVGVAARIKYGFLLDKMGGRLPVFRTETQDRMLKSAQNFAAGFFGIPAEDQFNLEVMIESKGFNNTLAPWNTCPDTEGYNKEVLDRLHQWDDVFLKDARKRLQKHITGYDLSINDVKDFMDMCAYETVALGYSAFCDLFEQKEWRGYEYRNDIYWWHAASFGYPLAKAQGLGWVQELVSRLTHTRLTEFNSTTNSSFHDDVHFPLNDPIYVDFTHDTEFALLLAAMNLTTFAESGEPPLDHIPKHRSFIASKFCPFGTNLQLQVLKCSSSGISAKTDRQVRLILNDAAVPLTGIDGCPKDEDGLCPFEAFVRGMKEIIAGVDFATDCVRE
ncbi:hypothetical protein JCM24511_09911 [Saitozyma sp. JCM 24511]|nr:hypothetical protein JCM24511_09911 [Saitozyma sp. JCM 24511]